MRTCPKCGSYLPDGKVLCPACGRPIVGVSGNARDSIRAERTRTHSRIQNAHNEMKRDAWLLPKQKNPYQGHTYEQHKSHDPRSKDYYKSKYETSAPNLPENARNLVCAAAYFGIFFVLPLLLLPNSREGRFHANQGLVLMAFNIFVGVLMGVLVGIFGEIVSVFAALPPLLMVYGAANALKGNMNELPLIGKFRLLKDDDMFGGR